MNGKPVEELTHIAHVSKARQVGKHIVNKLKECVPRQLFLIAIQAKVDGKVLARENIKALRKDVLAKCVSNIFYVSLFVAKYDKKIAGIEKICFSPLDNN